MADGWAEKAMATIDRARAEGETAGLSGKDLLGHIDAAYPFGPRDYWPYKAWLRARRLRCADLPGVRPLPTPKNRGGPTPPMRGQMDLFEEG